MNLTKMRRMKIRATPNLGAGVGPRSTPARSAPFSNTPVTTVSSATDQPSTITTSTASVNRQSQENTVDSLEAEETPADIHIVTTHKPDLKSVIPDNKMKKFMEDSCAPLDVLPHKPMKMDVAPTFPPSSSQIDTSFDSSLQNDKWLLSNSSLKDDISQNGTFLQNKESSLSQTSLPSTSSVSITSLQDSQILVSSPLQTSSVSVSSSSNSTLLSYGATPLMSPTVKQTLVPPGETLVKRESVETSHDPENKPTAGIRRKKIRVMPMVSSSRKGSMAEKQSDKTVNTQIDKKFTVKAECLDKVKSQQVSLKTVENVTCIVDVQNSKVQMKTDNRNEIIEVKAVTAENEHIEGKKESVYNEKQSSTASSAKVQSDLKDGNRSLETMLESKTPLVDKSLNLHVTENETLVLTDESETYGATLERTLEFSENNQSNVESSSTVTNMSCKRRSKIRAKPMFLAKRKIVKKDNDVEEENGKINLDTTENQSLLEESKTPANCNETSCTDHGTRMKTKINSLNRGELNKSVKIEDNVMQKLCKFDESDTDKAHKKLDVVENKVCNPLGSRLQRTKSDRLRIIREEPDRVEIVNNNSNSDDSCGDKENSSSLVSISRSMKSESQSKEKGKSPSLQKIKAKSSTVKFSPKKPLIKTEKKVKLKPSEGFSFDDSEEKTEKQIFRERKEIYRKKISRGVLERNNMTMFDLIFWNPASNPMPGRSETSRKKVRLSSKCETDSVASDDIDDLGLDISVVAPQSSPSTPEEVQVCQESDGTQKPPDEEAKEEATVAEDVLAPRVKIGPNGQIILDEQSIKIQTTAAKNRDVILSKAEVVEESNDSAHYGKWSKKRHRSNEWTIRETARFYKALSTVGTDFSLMETLFTWRSRAELKTKFKKEEKINRELVDRALKDCTQFDFSLFDDESDYDPEEDRKATRMAERAEARRKRQEMKQSEREQEQKEKKVQKKNEKADIKKRKTLLRKEYKRRKKKVGDSCDSKEESLCTEDQDVAQSDTEQQSLVQGLPEGVEKAVKKDNIRPAKKRQLERRNSLVISEVTVTMETVNSEKPKQPSDEYVTERTVVENSDADMGISKPFPFTTSHMGGAVPEFENTQKMWHFPVSAIQTLDDGRQTILVPTVDGQKSVPVPVLPLGTSNVVVVATGAPDSPGEHVYHVYVVSPQESAES